jgi:hypothetical protein
MYDVRTAADKTAEVIFMDGLNPRWRNVSLSVVGQLSGTHCAYLQISQLHHPTLSP